MKAGQKNVKNIVSMAIMSDENCGVDHSPMNQMDGAFPPCQETSL